MDKYDKYSKLEFIQSFRKELKNRDYKSTIIVAIKTAGILLKIIQSKDLYSNLEDLHKLIKFVGRMFISADMMQFSVGNIVKRILHFINQQRAKFIHTLTHKRNSILNLNNILSMRSFQQDELILSSRERSSSKCLTTTNKNNQRFTFKIDEKESPGNLSTRGGPESQRENNDFMNKKGTQNILNLKDYSKTHSIKSKKLGTIKSIKSGIDVKLESSQTINASPNFNLNKNNLYLEKSNSNTLKLQKKEDSKIEKTKDKIANSKYTKLVTHFIEQLKGLKKAIRNMNSANFKDYKFKFECFICKAENEHYCSFCPDLTNPTVIQGLELYNLRHYDQNYEEMNVSGIIEYYWNYLNEIYDEQVNYPQKRKSLNNNHINPGGTNSKRKSMFKRESSLNVLNNNSDKIHEDDSHEVANLFKKNSEEYLDVVINDKLDNSIIYQELENIPINDSTKKALLKLQINKNQENDLKSIKEENISDNNSNNISNKEKLKLDIDDGESSSDSSSSSAPFDEPIVIKRRNKSCKTVQVSSNSNLLYFSQLRNMQLRDSNNQILNLNSKKTSTNKIRSTETLVNVNKNDKEKDQRSNKKVNKFSIDINKLSNDDTNRVKTSLNFKNFFSQKHIIDGSHFIMKNQAETIHEVLSKKNESANGSVKQSNISSINNRLKTLVKQETNIKSLIKENNDFITKKSIIRQNSQVEEIKLRKNKDFAKLSKLKKGGSKLENGIKTTILKINEISKKEKKKKHKYLDEKMKQVINKEILITSNFNNLLADVEEGEENELETSLL